MAGWKQSPPKDSATVQTNDGQQYRLYPNPSHGIINLQQGIPDAMPVHAEIWDAIGRKIYSEDISFDNGQQQIRLANVNPGTYFVKLLDSKYRKFTFICTLE